MATHDPANGDCCACDHCAAVREAWLATSRADVALQAAAWRPRSKKLRALAEAAKRDREAALMKLARLTKCHHEDEH